MGLSKLSEMHKVLLIWSGFKEFWHIPSFFQTCGILLFKNSPTIILQSISPFRILNILSLLATSFIEEQHQTMYFIASSIFLLQLCQSKFTSKEFHSGLVGLLILKFSRGLNQTGDKWSHLPDYGDWFKKPENISYLIIFHIFGMILVTFVNYKNENTFRRKLLSISTNGLILIQKLTDLIGWKYLWPAQMVYFIVMIRMAFYIFSSNHRTKIQETLLSDVLPILTLLSAPHNTILIALHLYLQTQIVNYFTTMEYYGFFGWCLFFHQVCNLYQVTVHSAVYIHRG